MTNVGKYNLFKGISTVLTTGTPIITLMFCGSFFRHRSETALSAAGMFVILLSILFMKDKIMEYFKAPSALVISIVCLVLICIIENILLPMKIVCVTTICACTIDEFTLKNLYKSIELSLTDYKSYKKIGFYFCKGNKETE